VAFPPKNQNPISCVTEFRESLAGVEGGVFGSEFELDIFDWNVKTPCKCCCRELGIICCF
jgi:hypothetical protein